MADGLKPFIISNFYTENQVKKKQDVNKSDCDYTCIHVRK